MTCHSFATHWIWIIPFDYSCTYASLSRALKSHALSVRLPQGYSILCSHAETIFSHTFKIPGCFSEVPSCYLLWYNLILVRFVLASNTLLLCRATWNFNKEHLTPGSEWQHVQNKHYNMLRWFPSKRTHHRFPMKLGMLMLHDKEILKM